MFEINVSKLDVELNWLFHLFATAPRSCSSEYELEKVYKEIKKRFPESEGFQVTVTQQLGSQDVSKKYAKRFKNN